MKKLLCLALSVVTLVAMSSCSKDAAPSDEGSGKKSRVHEFKATVEGSCKTALDGKTVSWLKGDEIAVIDEDGAIFKFAALDSGTTSTFVQKTTGDLVGSTFYAVYPYSETLVWDSANKSVKVKTPSARAVKAGNFGNSGAAIMTACTTIEEGETTGELSFKNLANLMKFTVPKGLAVKRLYFYAGGHDLAGEFGVAIASDGTPSISAYPSSYDGLTLSTADTLAKADTLTPGTYYIPIIPAGYNNLRIKLTYKDDGISEAFNLNAFTANRNEFTNLGTLYDGRSFYKWLTFEDGNVPGVITDKAGTVTIEDNPKKGNTNPSLKAYKCYVASGTSSGYITIDLSGISSSIRQNIKGLKFHIIPVTEGTTLKSFTWVRYATNGGALSKTGVLPSTINNKTYSSQTEYKNNIVYGGYWNTLEYKASLFGVDNFKTITKIQIRQSQYYSSESNVTGPFTIYIDNIGFTYE